MRRVLRPPIRLLAALLVAALAACARTVDDWRRALHDEDPYERTLAVIALARSGEPAAVEDVFSALADPDEQVGKTARAELAGMGGAAAPRLLAALVGEGAPGERQRAIAASLLVEMGEASVGPMADALREGQLASRTVVARTLGRIGAPAVAPLAALLDDPDPDLAAAAARGLAETGRAGRPAAPALARALARPEHAVVVAAASALAAVGPDQPEALAALLASARATRGEAHELVLRAAVRGLLLQTLLAPDDDARERAEDAADALGFEAAGGLIVALETERSELAVLAADWLARLGPDALPPLLAAVDERDPDHIERTGRVVRRLGDPAIDVLMRLAQDADPGLRIKAVTALAALGQSGVRAMPALIDMLRDEDLDLVVAAAWALAQMTPPDAALLERVLAETLRLDDLARQTVMPCAVSGLALRLEAHPGERAERLRQLRGLGADGVTALQRLRDGDDPLRAASAARALEALAGR